MLTTTQRPHRPTVQAPTFFIAQEDLMTTTHLDDTATTLDRIQLPEMPTADVVPLAPSSEAPAGLPDGFFIAPDGIYVDSTDDEKPPLRLCSPLRVEATFCNAQNGGWGRLIAVCAPNNTWHRVPVLNGDMVARPGEVISRLVDHGLDLTAARHTKDLLVGLIRSWTPGDHKISVTRSGWLDESRDAFVIGDRTHGADRALPVVGCLSGFEARGTLADWRENVARLCVDNPLMIFAVSLAFTGPLLAPLGFDGGGLHFRGASSSGKTTLLSLAASVWGSATLVTQWRATSNGLEALAAMRNDLLLPLDELAEISAHDLHKSIYMLANGTGKARMTKDTQLSEPNRWRIALISSGEISVEQKLRESQRQAMAGHEVRLVDIEADARAYGAFDALHGSASPADFARGVNAAMQRFYGSAGPAFVEKLIASRFLDDPARIEKALSLVVDGWLAHLPAIPDGQITRVARRFALIGGAGHFATGLGLTGWGPREAISAAEKLFLDWHDRRYGEKHDNAVDHVETLKTWVAANKNALRQVKGPGADNPIGWRDDSWYYLPPSTWSRIFPGVSGTDAAKALIDVQILQPGDGKHLLKKAPRAIAGRPRLYTVNTDRLTSYKAG